MNTIVIESIANQLLSFQFKTEDEASKFFNLVMNCSNRDNIKYVLISNELKK